MDYEARVKVQEVLRRYLKPTVERKGDNKKSNKREFRKRTRAVAEETSTETVEEIREKAIRDIKLICRKVNGAASIMFQILIGVLKDKDFQLRMHALDIIDVLFTRSKGFRLQILRDFHTILATVRYYYLLAFHNPNNTIPTHLRFALPTHCCSKVIGTHTHTHTHTHRERERERERESVLLQTSFPPLFLSPPPLSPKRPADEWYEYMLKSGRNGDGGLDVIHEMQEEDKKQALDSPMNSFEAEQKVVAQKSKPKDLSYEVFQVAEHLREMFNTFREERLKKMRSRELQPGTTDIVAKSLIKKVGGGVEFVHTTSRLMQPTVVQINGVAAVHRSPILRRYFAIPFVVQAPEIDSIVSFQENSCSGVSTFSHVSSSITQLDIDPIAENKTRKRSNTGSAESEGPPNARKDSNMAGAQFLLRPVVTVFSGHVKPRMSVGLRFEEPLLHRLTGFHPVAQSYD